MAAPGRPPGWMRRPSRRPRPPGRKRARCSATSAGAPGSSSPLVKLWNRESSWNKYAYNPSSGAYGIPQAVPGSKMASAGKHWRTNATTQIRWGLGYIKSRYGYPRRAWDHELAYGWY